MHSQNHSGPSIFGTLGEKLHLRAGGHCECVSICAHHPPGRCRFPLMNGLWRIGLIVPTMPDGLRTMGNSEALCESCSVALEELEHPGLWRPYLGPKN